MKQTPSSTTQVETGPRNKKCMECCALLPISAFGLAKRYSDGYQPTCKLCRSEDNSFRWTEKHGRRHKMHQYEIIRSVKRQNRLILDAAFSAGKMELRGFDCETRGDYKVYYGPSERLGLMAFTLFTRDGNVFMEWALSGLRDPKAALLAYLRHHNVRLELTDLDVVNSKTQIYSLG